MSAAPAICVSSAKAADKDAWSRYLASSPQATVFHDWRWGEVIEAAHGHRPAHLMAHRGGALVGVLPLIDVKSPLLGRSLISTAFTIGGGAVADDAEAAQALAAAALDAGRARGVTHVELRGGALPDDAAWQSRSGIYANFEKSLPGDAAAILAMIPKRRRAEVRKALAFEQEGALSVRYDGEAEEFYRIYARSLRNLGTPALPCKFIRRLKEKFGDAAEIAIVESKGRAVAALFSFWFRDRVMPYYIGATDEAAGLRASDLLFYSLMQRAAARGATIFDFGRSKIGSPHYQYKTYWGFEPTPITYQVALVTAKTPPNVNPNNPKFAMFSKAWKHLPLPVANVLGPALARNFA